MNWTLSREGYGLPIVWCWPLALTLPIVLAGGILDKSRTSPSLPQENSYRSDFSDKVMESSQWRSEKQNKPGWREGPPAPGSGWRSGPNQQNQTGSPRGKVDLFPRYRSGDPAFFDHTTREEKGQVKVFEFGR